MSEEMAALNHDLAVGNIEWWVPDEDTLAVREVAARRVRAAWSLAVGARTDLRQSLTDHGFIQVDRSRAFFENDHLLSTYTEVWIGREGTVSIEWNRDPTDPGAGA